MSRFLIDSSAVWRFRRDDALAASWDVPVIGGDVRSCAPQRVELLRSMRNADEFERDSAILLETFPDVAVPKTVWRWVDSAQLRLAHAGVLRAFSVVDLLICATAAHHGLAILHDDNDFVTAARHLADIREERV
ncbi:PIN domain-containing protein [Nocardioides sp.]|uniref:PIN domain-containing protein n=1 Tax=Nocardioides sp. TaxID=35761 RepID=UPI0039E5F026